eukprot:SAG31_NODE_3414_length_4302_cov_20.546239_3_plen_161_part_00
MRWPTRVQLRAGTIAPTTSPAALAIPKQQQQQRRRQRRLLQLQLLQHGGMECSRSVRGASTLVQLRQERCADLAKLAEVQAREVFRAELASGTCEKHAVPTPRPLLKEDGGVLTKHEVRLALEAGLATFLLHVESRVSSACGQGFYTIGPCGEEILSGVS